MGNDTKTLNGLLIRRTFTDDAGEVVASYRINPADVNLANRCNEVAAFFEELGKNTPPSATLEDMLQLNNQLEEKICYLLGYDARQSLFGFISAASIMADGELFAVYVVNDIFEAAAPQIRKRAQAMKQAVEKHTAKYTK